jgi:hypothetical protein
MMAKMAQSKEVMFYQRDIEIAREIMLQAEKVLEDYLRGSVHDLELAKQLRNAVEVSREEFINKLATLCPNDVSTSDDSSPSTTASLAGAFPRSISS